MKKTRSFLKWAGSKFNCLNKILPSFPDSDTLIEPFVGSGVIFMNTNYKINILAEGNNDLINLFTYLQKDLTFIDFCEQLFLPENNSNAKYYKLRDKFNQTNDSKERAALFLYLNRHGYNGLCRYNNSGIYNVPFGRYIKPYFPRNEMILFHKKSLNAKFIYNDFIETFKIAKPGNLIYCDPPYSPINQNSNFSKYTTREFGEKEHILLVEAAKIAANNNIKVIISNHDTEFTREQYKDADIKSFPVARLINCDINHRFPVNELIAIF